MGGGGGWGAAAVFLCRRCFPAPCISRRPVPEFMSVKTDERAVAPPGDASLGPPIPLLILNPADQALQTASGNASK